MRDNTMSYRELNPVFLAYYINKYFRGANLACLDFGFDQWNRNLWWTSGGNQERALNTVTDMRRTADFVLMFHNTGARRWPGTNDLSFSNAEGCPCTSSGARVHDSHRVAVIAHQGNMQYNVVQALHSIGRMRNSQQTLRYHHQAVFNHQEWYRMRRCDGYCRWDRRAC